MRLKILNLIMTVVIGFTCNAQSSQYSNERDRYFTEIYNAAEQGNAEAQYNLGLCYQRGQGVAKDYVEAMRWYRKAAEQGHAGAIKSMELIEQKALINLINHLLPVSDLEYIEEF